MKDIIVTIDGPAAAGKTTISKALSDALGFVYVDTGALYRTVALFMVENNIDTDSGSDIIDGLSRIDIKMEPGKGVFLNGENVSARIRTPEISMAASKISAQKEVRDFLFGIQKSIGESKNAVFEGRDMGTIVFPDADVKFFLTADIKIRAKRRHMEMGENSNQNFEVVLNDMEKRDKSDSSREHAPLKPAEDAFLIDSTGLSQDEVKGKMLELIAEKFK